MDIRVVPSASGLLDLWVHRSPGAPIVSTGWLTIGAALHFAARLCCGAAVLEDDRGACVSASVPRTASRGFRSLTVRVERCDAALLNAVVRIDEVTVYTSTGWRTYDALLDDVRRVCASVSSPHEGQPVDASEDGFAS